MFVGGGEPSSQRAALLSRPERGRRSLLAFLWTLSEGAGWFGALRVRCSIEIMKARLVGNHCRMRIFGLGSM